MGRKNNNRLADRVRRIAQHREADNNDTLSEFSDSSNDFYVDEIKERRRERTAERRERKKEKKKEKQQKPMTPTGRKIIRIVSFITILTVILVVGVVLSLTVLFKTQTYLVEGNTHYDEQEIIDTCGISTGENIFLAPKAPAERKIKDKYAYVENVKVGFQIPDTITIRIEEAVEGYLVEYGDEGYLLVSTKGRILDKITDISGYNLPVFIGPAPLSGEIGDYIEYEDDAVPVITDTITEVFTDNGYSGITEINCKNPADVSFTYDNRIKVRLGLPEDLSYKIRTAMTIITEKIDVNASVSVEGELDVSRCNVTKRSYFDEKPLLSLDQPQAPTTSGDSAAQGNITAGTPTEAPADSGFEEEKETEPLPQDQWYID